MDPVLPGVSVGVAGDIRHVDSVKVEVECVAGQADGLRDLWCDTFYVHGFFGSTAPRCVVWGRCVALGVAT